MFRHASHQISRRQLHRRFRILGRSGGFCAQYRWSFSVGIRIWLPDIDGRREPRLLIIYGRM